MMRKIRLAQAGDAELLWQWRNEWTVRMNSFDTAPISWADHKSWFTTRIASADTRIYILEDEGKPVAQIRYDRRDNSVAEVGSISVAEDKRGMGHGKFLLVHTIDKACAELRVKTLIATVKTANIISAEVFRAAGFGFLGRITEQRCPCNQFIFPCLAHSTLQA